MYRSERRSRILLKNLGFKADLLTNQPSRQRQKHVMTKKTKTTAYTHIKVHKEIVVRKNLKAHQCDQHYDLKSKEW